MLPKKFRLKNYSAFIATYKQNNAISDKNICVYFGRKITDDKINTRIAFVVGKKIHKRAVVRNRIKRLMRENFRKLLLNSDYSFIYEYTSIICVAKNSAVEANYYDIKNSFEKILLKRNKNIWFLHK